MITAWAWNELASTLKGDDPGMELILPHGVSNSTWERRVLLNNELIRCRAWGAGGGLTPAQCGSLSDPTRPVKHAQSGTARAQHQVGTGAWIEGIPGELELEQLTDDPDAWLTSLNGDVNVVIPDGRGGWYVGGDFTLPAGRLMHLNAAREVDLSFVADCDAEVLALCLSPDGSRLLVGGSFNAINATTALYGAIVDASTGALLDDLAGDAEVRSIVLGGGNVAWLAGDFNGINGQANKYYSRLNWATGANTSVDYYVDISGGAGVTSVAWDDDGNQLFLVGSFTFFNSGTIPRSGAGAVSMDTSHPVADRVTAWAPVFNAVPNKIRLYEEQVYAGGDFTTVNGLTARRLVRVDPAVGVWDDSWVPDATGGTVNDFWFHGTSLLVGGAFTNIGGQARARAAILSLATALATSWDTAANGTVFTVAVSLGRMAMGGSFTSLDADGNAEDRMGMWTDWQVHSVVGRYRFEFVETYDSTNPTQSISWDIFHVDASGEYIVYSGDELIEAVIESDGVHWTGPDILLTDPLASYVAVVTRTRLDGATDQEATAQYTSCEAGIWLVPDGSEHGDMWIEVDAWAAPVVSKLGTVYTVTPATVTTSPVSTNQKQFFRLWAISGTDFDNLEVDWTGSSENIPVPIGKYFYSRLWGNFNAAGPNYTLTVEARLGLVVQVTNGGDTIDVDTATTTVFPDQVQVQREADIGTPTGPQESLVISDWQPPPVALTYVAQGPGAWTYRYRYRYRDFRRDGINDERGPIEIMSTWSSWSSFV